MPPASRLSVYTSLDELPADTLRVFDAGRRRDFALGPQWFGNLIANGLPADAVACLAVLRHGSTALAVAPMLRHGNGGLSSLTNCYTCCYTPLIAEDAPEIETARSLGRELGALCARCPAVRIEALPAEWPALDAFIAGVGEAGLLVRRFAMFGNWHEAFAGRSWPEYLADRPGSLRELIRRKSRQAARGDRIEFETVRAPAALPDAIAAYETVYSRSWKTPEPCPRFNPGLMREAAELGALRLAIGWLRGVPVAAQLWIVANGRATVMKLAHDEAHHARSPGTLLTAHVIRELIGEGVEAIDFGRGDDPYKRLWARDRRQRIGLLLLNPRRVRGLVALARHDAGRALRPLRSGQRREHAAA